MQELSIGTLLAVFQEVFGAGVFWGMVVLAVLILIAFTYLILREHKLVSGRFLRAELMAPVGAIAAIVFVQWFTSSGFGDIGGPIDVIVLIGIGTAGAIGLTILAYVVLGFLNLRRVRAGEESV